MMKVALIVFVSGQLIAWMLVALLAYFAPSTLESDGLGTGWGAPVKLAFAGAYLIAVCAGVVVIVLFLLRGIRRLTRVGVDKSPTDLRRARSWEDLIPTPTDVGSATATWIRLVVVLLLWVAGSVIAIVLRVPDGYAVILGWLLPLAAFLVYRRRRSAGHA